jgi:peptidoglycan hydrolase-like protein with peptidoglycan-binding domain
MAPAVQKQPLAQLICASPAVSRAELSYVIAYSALRQTSTDTERATMHAEADAFTRRMTEECGIQPTGYLGGRAPTQIETSCLLDHFSVERGRLLMRLNGEAMEEARLAPEQTMTIQMLLKNKGFLTANEAIDGVFGPTTRSAIGDWQRSVGQRATGFGSAAMLDQLQGSLQTPAPAQATLPAAAPTMTPAPAAPPALVQTTTAQRADFSAADISIIAETSKTNEIRFGRDYKGRTFADTMVLANISESLNKGTYRVSLKSNLSFGFGGGVDCKLSDPRSLDIAVNWNKGQRVEVSGIIEDTSLGDLVLSGCGMRAL